MGAFYVDVKQESNRTYLVEGPDITTEEEARAAYVDRGSLRNSETSPEEVWKVTETAEGV